MSNTLIPGIHDAYFFANGKRIIIRYIDRQKNTVVGLIASVPSVSESGDALPLRSIQYLNSEVVSVAVNKKMKMLHILLQQETGVLFIL